MRIEVAPRGKQRGKVTVLPAFAGKLTDGAPGGVPLKGIRVGSDAGEITTLCHDGRLLAVVSLGQAADCKSDTFRRAGGLAAKWLAQREVRTAGLDTRAAESAKCDLAMAALCEGLVLGSFRFDEHKSDAKPVAETRVDLLVTRPSQTLKRELKRVQQTAAAANVARALAHQPPNVINPVSLAARARALARQCGLGCTVLDERQMGRLRMGGIMAVGQGSDTPPRLIVLSYRGSSPARPVVLVGKAITFDTGGYSIKTRDGILGMKYDKCGGTTVLGAMHAVAALEPRVPVVGIIAAAENMISGGAYRPDDIITTMSGKTVEIVSADAEGRMVLCDALTYAQRKWKPRAIIDLATLTGGVVVSLGKLRAGLFCTHERLREALLASGERTDELLWPLPLDDGYLEGLKGNDSDLRNSGGREGHAILAAVFLKQFVGSTIPWAHLDIAGVADVDKDQPYCPKGATGFGVRLLADYLAGLRP